MLKATKKIALAVVLAMVLTTVVIFAAILYPNAKFVFSGMTMQNGANGEVQGLINLRLENVNATGVNFKIVYDENYIVPSDYSTNEETEDYSTVYVQNTENFPENSLSSVFRMMTDNTLYVSISPDKNNLDAAEDNGGIKFSPDYEAEEKSYFYIAADDYVGGLDLGVLSFQIVNPAAVSAMTQAELNDIFYVVEDSMNISYYDEENKFCEETIDYEWDVTLTLIDAWTVIDEVFVLASDIYNTGTAEDLVNYLNLNYNDVQLRWSNNLVTLDRMTWDFSKCTITGTYSPKGGTYTVTQPYNDKFDVSVTVNVEEVNLLRLGKERLGMVYRSGEHPTLFEDLGLPEKVSPVLDKTVTRFTLPDVDLDIAEWNPNYLSDDFVAGVMGRYEFTNTPDISALEAAAPWLTTDNAERDVTVVVNIMERPPLGPPVVGEAPIYARVDKYTGVLTITVPGIKAEEIPVGAGFAVRFPNGLVLDASDSIMTESIIGTVGKIVIDTDDLSDAQQNIIQSMINLGGKDFAVAIRTTDDVIVSDYESFESPRRENYYTQDEYIDYSGANSVFFKVYEGTALADLTKHITFADSSIVHIAYNGITGQEPGTMREVHVDEWTIKDDSSAYLPAAGTTVTLVGTMTDGYFYTNHGTVTNEDGYIIELTVTIADASEPPENEQIKVTTNETEVYEQEVDEINPFYYDVKQVGYSEAQEQTFTIHNIGQADIEGLNVQLSSTDFVLTGTPGTTLPAETGETTFRISTKTGLGAGTYTATVTVSSNTGNTLKTFDIIFTVTDQEVYEVVVIVNDPTLGDARVVGSTYYTEGSDVSLVATPNTGCVFVSWTSTDLPEIDGSVNLSEGFIMPAQSVTIYATFEESLEGKLRIDDLRVKNPDNTDNDLTDPVTGDKIPFSRDTYEYHVTVPYETDQNKLWIKPRNEEIDGVTIVPAIDNDGTDIPCTLDSDGYYKTVLFDLTVGENVYVITQTHEGVEQVYTVIITRKNQVGVTLIHGNSPFGLIEADTTLSEAQKTAEKEYFSANYRYNTVPEGAATTGTQIYYPDAWTYKNYDEDPAALFVYSGKAFVDPGFENLVNSAGDPVDAALVTRTITAEQMTDPTGTDAAAKLADTAEIVDIITGGGQSCVISTAVKFDLRPGIYKIVYSFTDSDGSENSFSRPLILLYDKGDANVTGEVDTNDYSSIYGRMKNGISTQVINNADEAWCAVYAYRICDVNSDRNVNSIDANNIKSNRSITKFYELLPESL